MTRITRITEDADLLFKEESYRIVGACFQVYNDKGCGFLEGVYQECLEVEFELQNIPAISQPGIQIEYKGRILNHVYVPDFVCFGDIIVELKALPKLTEQHRAQVINYLRASKKRLGILVNFGHFPKLEYIRVTSHDSWEQAPADFRA